VVLRNFEGVITTYDEPENYASRICDGHCETCQLELNLNEGEERESLGIERLLSDENDTICLVPEDNDRIQRRDENENV
jgi:lysine 2,3-aminomutase